jgi:hypothetical protein
MRYRNNGFYFLIGFIEGIVELVTDEGMMEFNHGCYETCNIKM